MANPMQRRAKNAFLLGFLIATLIMALIVAALVYKITTVNEEIDELKSKQVSVWVAATDLESGTDLDDGTLINQMVQTTVNKAEIVDNTILGALDEETGEPIKYKSKIKIPAGSIITQDMIYVDGEEVAKDERLQEYNTISLPSQLQNGDYIDIRFKLATGEDFIVLPKKKVEGTTADTIWLKVDEEEILTLNSVIIEAGMLKGSKLYAIEYTEPGIQEKAVQTYPVNADVLKQIEVTPNMLKEAKDSLYSRYNVDQRNKIEAGIQSVNDERNDLVEKGTSTETQKIQQQRNEYVTSLEGTGLIGYTAEE